MHALIRQLLSRGPVLTDGAWGTQLQARGLPIGEMPEGWNLSHPEDVCGVARAYVAAGSRIILTNTFGGNRCRLEAAGLSDRVRELNLRGVELSRKAAEGRAWVFASIGPSGKMLLADEITRDELGAAFEQQAAALAEGGADGLVVETMGDLDEALLAVAAARATDLPVVACMVFDSGKNRDQTIMGLTPEEAAKALTDAGADVIGANCGRGMGGFALICARLRSATDRPIWIKPNAGLPEIVDGRAAYRTSPEEFAGGAQALVAAGASFVGGCCGTSPDFIQALDQKLHAGTQVSPLLLPG
ncbi:MAG: homocysteine S-methyltransferase family protein [Verrucomicrobia bacterium]|nr:homocysteine S-methyltransferase family protein [Verrucomicrobiota bacterium]